MLIVHLMMFVNVYKLQEYFKKHFKRKNVMYRHHPFNISALVSIKSVFDEFYFY